MKLIAIEKITCLECGRIVDGKITEHTGLPYCGYIGECECGYIITESEWEPVIMNLTK